MTEKLHNLANDLIGATPITPEDVGHVDDELSGAGAEESGSYHQKTVSPHPLSSQFDDYLVNYQLDLERIITKHRGKNHKLSVEEIVSEANLSLVKNRDSILSNFKGPFSELAFKKLAYRFARNVIVWTQSRLINTKYEARRLNYEHYTEDGPKTTYELALESEGYEEDFYVDFDRDEKCKYLLHMVTQYSDILSDGEIKVLAYSERGLNQEEIAEIQGTTRQAVSVATLRIFDKIRVHFGVSPFSGKGVRAGKYSNGYGASAKGEKEVITDNSWDKVKEGKEALASFFELKPGNTKIKEEHKDPLKQFLLENACLYTGQEAASLFAKGIYTGQQLISFAAKNKIGFCLKKTRASYKFTKFQEEQILLMSEKGKSTRAISKALNIPHNSVAGKKSHFVVLGKLPKHSGS